MSFRPFADLLQTLQTTVQQRRLFAEVFLGLLVFCENNKAMEVVFPVAAEEDFCRTTDNLR